MGTILDTSGWRIESTKKTDGSKISDRKVVMLRPDGQPCEIQEQYVPFYLQVKGYKLVDVDITIPTDAGVYEIKHSVNLEDIPDVISAAPPKISKTSRADLKKAKEAAAKLAATKNTGKSQAQPAPEPEPAEPVKELTPPDFPDEPEEHPQIEKVEEAPKPKPRRKPTTKKKK